MLISFVIPVYNVEKYVGACIESILGQKFTDYEILLVDDGSTDTSGKLCDEYARRFPFISVIHKENGGLSDARNAGLQAAGGEYILFVDSDDYIGENSLQEIADCLKQDDRRVDVMFLEAVKFFPDGAQYPMGDGYVSEKINGCSKDAVMAHLAALPKFPGSACTKLLRRDLLVEQDLYFEKGMLSEDIEWTIRLLKSAQVFAYCGARYYYYRQSRAGSITNTANLQNIECNLSTIEKLGSKDLSIPYQKDINAFMAYEYIVVLFNYAGLSKTDKRAVHQRVRNAKWTLSFGTTRKIRLVKRAVSVLGINGTSRLLKIYKSSFNGR